MSRFGQFDWLLKPDHTGYIYVARSSSTIVSGQQFRTVLTPKLYSLEEIEYERRRILADSNRAFDDLCRAWDIQSKRRIRLFPRADV
jgi:hypothetical protein